jgi:hypothetical protein
VHTALLAFLLVAITVDPRLEEPLRLLAEVRDRDGELVGAEYARRARHPHITVVVLDLPVDAGRSAAGNPECCEHQERVS